MSRLFNLFRGKPKVIKPPNKPYPGIEEPVKGDIGNRPGDFGIPIADREKRKDERELFGKEISDPFLSGELALFVDSSWVDVVKYDPNERALKVQFLDGHKHTYAFGSEGLEMAKAFMRANSKGTWLHDNVFIRGPRNADGTIPVRSGITDYEGW